MKYNFEFIKNDYKTPPVLYEKALVYFGKEFFNLDTCCTEENIPALRYYKNGEKDGLSEPWEDYCWCNPPFNDCAKWVEKAYNENQEKGINIAMLIPVRTETAYWHKYILNNLGVDIVWLRKGYRFLDKDNQEMGIFKNALALVFFKGF